MGKKYGGVDNKKELNNIQEAIIVGAPRIIPHKEKRSIGSIIAGWIFYIIVTFYIIFLLLVIIDDGNMRIPSWLIITLSLLPTILRIAYSIRVVMVSRKSTGK